MLRVSEFEPTTTLSPEIEILPSLSSAVRPFSFNLSKTDLTVSSLPTEIDCFSPST